jgi:hypothetical protein
MVAHHTVGGCNLRSGDLLGTGTISCNSVSPGLTRCLSSSSYLTLQACVCRLKGCSPASGSLWALPARMLRVSTLLSVQEGLCCCAHHRFHSQSGADVLHDCDILCSESCLPCDRVTGKALGASLRRLGAAHSPSSYLMGVSAHSWRMATQSPCVATVRGLGSDLGLESAQGGYCRVEVIEQLHIINDIVTDHSYRVVQLQHWKICCAMSDRDQQCLNE